MRDPTIPVSVDGEASQTMQVTYPVGNRPFHPIPTVDVILFEVDVRRLYQPHGTVLTKQLIRATKHLLRLARHVGLS